MRAGVRNPRSTDDSWLIRLLIEALIVAGAPGVGSDQLPAKVRPTPGQGPTNSGAKSDEPPHAPHAACATSSARRGPGPCLEIRLVLAHEPARHRRHLRRRAVVVFLPIAARLVEPVGPPRGRVGRTWGPSPTNSRSSPTNSRAKSDQLAVKLRPTSGQGRTNLRSRSDELRAKVRRTPAPRSDQPDPRRQS